MKGTLRDQTMSWPAQRALAVAALVSSASAQVGMDWVFPGPTVAAGQICHLQYYHNEIAQPLNLTGSLCSAWSDNSCCSSSTAHLHQYDQADAAGHYDGDGFGISDCGVPSLACQKWFLAEACLYECDVNAGRYRHHSGDAACAADNNGWQMSGFPLKVPPVLCPDVTYCSLPFCINRPHEPNHAHEKARGGLSA